MENKKKKLRKIFSNCVRRYAFDNFSFAFCYHKTRDPVVWYIESIELENRREIEKDKSRVEIDSNAKKTHLNDFSIQKNFLSMLPMPFRFTQLFLNVFGFVKQAK